MKYMVDRGTSRVLDENGDSFAFGVCAGRDQRICRRNARRNARRIAAALNRDEARTATKDWTVKAMDGWNMAIMFKDGPVSEHDVAALLNKLGATLPKRKPARKGEKR